MAKGKGGWSGGKSPAQGGGKRRVSRPEQGKLQKGPFGKGKKTARGRGGKKK